MKILFLMDPFIDLDWSPKRTFVLNNDLCLTKFSFNKDSSDKIEFIGLKSLIVDAKIQEELNNKNVLINEFDDKELLLYIKNSNTNLLSIITNKISNDTKKCLLNYLKNKIKHYDFDLVIYWEFISEIFFELFPNSTFLEGSHSGLYRLENNVDIFYIAKKKSFYDYKFIDHINQIQVNSTDINNINNISTFLNDTILFNTNITREFIDPENKFQKILFYPLHFESNRFIADTNFVSQTNFLNHILNKLPKDYAIVVTKHPLNKSIKFNNERIIDLSEHQESDPHLSLRLIKITDGLINVFSSIFIFATLLNKPIFTFGKDLYAKFCSTNIETIVEYFSNSEKKSNIDDSYKVFSYKILKYIFTHKINISFFQYYSTTTMYFRRIANIREQYDKRLIIPTYSSIEWYYHQLTVFYLLSPKISKSYKENINLTEIYKYIFIPTIKNVGFDIFDTLLQRPFWNPKQLFDIIEPEANALVGCETFGFSNTRILSEEYARTNKIEVTIDQIYEAMGILTGLPNNILESLKKLELSYEKKVLKPRYFVKNIFELMKIYGKKIFIASDMYLSKEFLVNILTEQGYDLSNVKIYISSDIKKVKHDGSLFKEIIEKEQLKPSETLFIGDNEKSDILMPSKFGLNTFLIPKAIDMYRQALQFRISELKVMYEANWSLHIPLIANILFDNPFINYNYNSYINNSSKLLGFYAFGPLVTSLIFWLIEKIEAQEFNQVLFAARDSKLIFEIYNEINEKIYHNKLPKSYYVAMSRTALLPCYNKKISRINLVNLYVSNLNTHNFLEKMFNIEILKDKKAKKIASKVNLKIHDYAKFQKHQIILFLNEYYKANDKNEIDTLYIKNYFEKFTKGKTALFDLGARATSKDVLEEILDNKINCFLFRSAKYKFNKRTNSYFKDTLNTYRTGIKKILPSFYETILSDNLSNTCEGYEFDKIKNESIPKVSLKNKLNRSDIFILETQHSIKYFVSLYLSTFEQYSRNINLDSKDIYILPISKLSAGFVDRELLNEYLHDDPLGKNEQFPIIPTMLEKKIETNISNLHPINKNILSDELSSNHKREIFIYYKRKFYKTIFGKLIWDFGRKIYLKLKK